MQEAESNCNVGKQLQHEVVNSYTLIELRQGNLRISFCLRSFLFSSQFCLIYYWKLGLSHVLFSPPLLPH